MTGDLQPFQQWGDFVGARIKPGYRLKSAKMKIDFTVWVEDSDGGVNECCYAVYHLEGEFPGTIALSGYKKAHDLPAERRKNLDPTIPPKKFR